MQKGGMLKKGAQGEDIALRFAVSRSNKEFENMLKKKTLLNKEKEY